jgi:hypothetical protein
VVAVNVKFAAKFDVPSRLVVVVRSNVLPPPVLVSVNVVPLSKNFRAPLPDRFMVVIVMDATAVVSIVPVKAPAVREEIVDALRADDSVTVPPPEEPSNVTVSPEPGTD